MLEREKYLRCFESSSGTKCMTSDALTASDWNSLCSEYLCDGLRFGCVVQWRRSSMCIDKSDISGRQSCFVKRKVNALDSSSAAR